ncbi:MAG: hypothetical protein IPH20_25705 [Bacteroidales bacterium]|nr:hypothetical protein [Bacteroidales bacterium]
MSVEAGCSPFVPFASLVPSWRRAQGTGHRAQGTGLRAQGMEHGAWGMEHGLSRGKSVFGAADKGLRGE